MGSVCLGEEGDAGIEKNERPPRGKRQEASYPFYRFDKSEPRRKRGSH